MNRSECRQSHGEKSGNLASDRLAALIKHSQPDLLRPSVQLLKNQRNDGAEHDQGDRRSEYYTIPTDHHGEAHVSYTHRSIGSSGCPELPPNSRGMLPV
jgi:hypothetical protein